MDDTKMCLFFDWGKCIIYSVLHNEFHGINLRNATHFTVKWCNFAEPCQCGEHYRSVNVSCLSKKWLFILSLFSALTVNFNSNSQFINILYLSRSLALSVRFVLAVIKSKQIRIEYIFSFWTRQQAFIVHEWQQQWQHVNVYLSIHCVIGGTTLSWDRCEIRCFTFRHLRSHSTP